MNQGPYSLAQVLGHTRVYLDEDYEVHLFRPPTLKYMGSSLH